MAVLTLATSASPFPANFRTANQAPYAMGTRISVGSGDISMSGGYEGVIFTSLVFNCSGNTTTSNLYGNIWNNAGDSIAVSGSVSATSDTTSPFTARTFNISDIYVPSGSQVFAGYSRFAASPTAWQVIESDFSTRESNYDGTGSSGPLLLSGTQTTNRRMVGTATYDLYDAGTISRSIDSPSTSRPRITFGGINGTLAKTITVNWGDGSSNQTASIVALRNFTTTPLTITKTAAYDNPGTYTITITISFATTSVGIPDIVFTNTYYTPPSVPQNLVATPTSPGIYLDWDAPSYIATGIFYYRVRRNGSIIHDTPDGSTTYFTDTSASPGVSYTYTVTAIGTGGESSSATVSATGLPAVPSSVYSTTFSTSTFSSNLSSTFSVNLHVDATTNGSAIIRYEASIDNDVTFTSLGLPTNGLVTLSGLTKTTYYTVRVRAVNGIGNSTPVTTNWYGYDFYNGTQYSTTSFTHGGRYKSYIDSESYGQEWAPLYLKKYNGTAFVDIPIQIYNGTVWGYTDA